MLVAAVLEVSRSPSHVPRSEGFRMFCSKHGRHFSRFLSSRLTRWSHMVECQPRGAPKARAIRGVSVVGGWLSDNEVGTSKLGMKIVGGDFFFGGWYQEKELSIPPNHRQNVWSHFFLGQLFSFLRGPLWGVWFMKLGQQKPFGPSKMFFLTSVEAWPTGGGKLPENTRPVQNLEGGGAGVSGEWLRWRGGVIRGGVICRFRCAALWAQLPCNRSAASTGDTIRATWWSWLCLAFGWWQVLELQCPKARVIPWRLMKWLVMCLKHHVPRQIFGMRRDMCRRVRTAAIARHHVRTPRILATITILLQALATTWQPTKWAVMLRKHHALRPMFGMHLASYLAAPAAATASSPVRMCQIPAITMTFQMRRLHLPPPHPDLPGVVMMCLRTPATVMCRRQSVQGLGPDPARIVWGMASRHQLLDPTARCWF